MKGFSISIKGSLLLLLVTHFPCGHCDEGKQGLLLSGGLFNSSVVPMNFVELWSPDHQCSLDPLPIPVEGHTMDWVDNSVVACGGINGSWTTAPCVQFKNGTWQPLKNTKHPRYSHTSTVLGKQLLLTGGFFSPNTTELLPVDGDDASVEGFPFNPTLWDHCAIQVDQTTVVITGGYLRHPKTGSVENEIPTRPFEFDKSQSLVTELAGLGGQVTTRHLPELNGPRVLHACGMYENNQEKWLIVAGGLNAQEEVLSSVEILQHSNGALQPWKLTTPLPSTLWMAKGSNLNGYFHISGGQFDYNQSFNITNEILKWDHVNLEWRLEGHMVTKRDIHAAAVVPLDLFSKYCTN